MLRITQITVHYRTSAKKDRCGVRTQLPGGLQRLVAYPGQASIFKISYLHDALEPRFRIGEIILPRKSACQEQSAHSAIRIAYVQFLAITAFVGNV